MTKEEFNEKWENYWYHYKWHTLIALFVAFCIIFTVTDHLTRKANDFEITYIGDYMDYEGLAGAVTEKYGDIIGDINGDGVVKTEVNNIYTAENIAYDSDINLWQRVDMDIINGQSYIYLVDEHLLSSFIGRGANGVIKTKDGYEPYIEITDNEFFKPYLPKDKKVYLLVRQKFQGKIDESIEKIEDASTLLLEKILEK